MGAVSLYSVDQIRRLERHAIEQAGIPGSELMERAGTQALAVLRARWPRAQRLAILCGLGNNAGDGFVLARLARAAGLDARVLQVGDPERLGGDARLNQGRWQAEGGPTEPWAGEIGEADVVVDALFGIGLDRPVEGVWAEVVAAINAHPAPILALDVPSGLQADSGRILGTAVEASLTTTFIADKAGFFTADGPDCVGETQVCDLDLRVDAEVAGAPVAEGLGAELVSLLPRRRKNSHKGTYGHVLVVGGNRGMAGAARMAAEGALRAGAGLVSVATHPDNAATLGAGRPELMVHGVDDERSLLRLLGKADVLVIGPGLGLDGWTRMVWRNALEAELPTVADADALALLSPNRQLAAPWVMTPHPGEAHRMLSAAGSPALEDRYALVRELQEHFGGVMVLKGCGTLVDDGRGPVGVCHAGNPGMATGGMGDILTGIIGALMGQGLSASQAARLGVWSHANAADQAAEDGERGLLPLDILPYLRCLLDGRAA